MSQTTLTYDASILERVVSPAEPGLAAEAARAMLLFAFPESDHVRIHELSEKSRQGALTAEEEAEAESYERVGSLLGLLQSKARLTLRHLGASSAS